MTESYFPKDPTHHLSDGVAAKVLSFHYIGEQTPEREKLQQGIQELFENLDVEFSGLVTGHRVAFPDEEIEKIYPCQTSGPELSITEIKDRGIQRLMRQWLRSGMTAEILFYEKRLAPEFTKLNSLFVTYAWVFKGLRPENTGTDLVSGSPMPGRSPSDVRYHLGFTGRYVDDLQGALVTAEEIENARRQSAEKPTPVQEPTNNKPSPGNPAQYTREASMPPRTPDTYMPSVIQGNPTVTNNSNKKRR